MLVDIVERFGRDAVAQVDLGVREHRNRPIEELAPQAMAIIATALRRAGVMQLEGPFLELLRYAPDGSLDTTAVEVRERPPINSLPEYRARFS